MKSIFLQKERFYQYNETLHSIVFVIFAVGTGCLDKVCCSKQHVPVLLFYWDIVVKKVWIENNARMQVLVCGIVWVSAPIFAQDAEQGSSIRRVFIKSS